MVLLSFEKKQFLLTSGRNLQETKFRHSYVRDRDRDAIRVYTG